MDIINNNNSGLLKQGCVATVGFFDGLHLGHRYLIEELKTQAAQHQLKSLIITFSVHPRKVLHSDFQPMLLTSLNEKLEQLATTGMDACVVLDFSLEMAQLSAQQFLKNILQERFSVQTLLVGHDHRFGHNRVEGFEDYLRYGQQMGMSLIKANRYTTNELNHISSSEIRKALNEGELANANAMLGYEFGFSGKVVDGFKVGRKIGFPTANIEPEDTDKLIPTTGVYDVKLKIDGMMHRGMMNIGNRPTLQNGLKRSIEVNIFDFNKDIYNERVEVKFVRRIRDEIKFENIDALIAQLTRDKEFILNTI
jgi:riboflavin kinase / FMN adenylyltransferase